MACGNRNALSVFGAVPLSEVATGTPYNTDEAGMMSPLSPTALGPNDKIPPREVCLQPLCVSCGRISLLSCLCLCLLALFLDAMRGRTRDRTGVTHPWFVGRATQVHSLIPEVLLSLCTSKCSSSRVSSYTMLEGSGGADTGPLPGGRVDNKHGAPSSGHGRSVFWVRCLRVAVFRCDSHSGCRVLFR